MTCASVRTNQSTMLTGWKRSNNVTLIVHYLDVAYLSPLNPIGTHLDNNLSLWRCKSFKLSWASAIETCVSVRGGARAFIFKKLWERDSCKNEVEYSYCSRCWWKSDRFYSLSLSHVPSLGRRVYYKFAGHEQTLWVLFVSAAAASITRTKWRLTAFAVETSLRLYIVDDFHSPAA